uniref:Kelch-like protein 18 n=1 Tax=Ascaris suum TaxID=6253 RepID=F1KWQ3_ASCSU
MMATDDTKRYISLLTMCDEDDEEAVVFECGASLAASAFPNFDEIRRAGKLCDVVLTASGFRFSAHRVVLAATIPYFRAMFTAEMAECQQKEVHLQEFDADTLEQLIAFAYTGRVRITNANVQSIMQAANFLQLNNIVDECCRFLQCRLQSQNVLGIRSFAMALGCVSLVLSADRYLHKHFMQVSQGEEYLALSVDELSPILNRDELFVESEEQIFEAAMRWLEHDPDREQYSARILRAVRLPLLKPHFLTDQVASHSIIRKSLNCRDLVDEAKDYHLMPERRHLMKTFRTKQRCCYDVPGLIFAVGGLTNTGDSLSTVEMFDPTTGKWSCVQPMNSIRSRVGVAVMNRQLYAIGGFNGHDRLRTVEVFDPETSKWREVCPLTNKRSALGAAVVNERLYVCGGYDGISSLSSVEVYNAITDRWSMTTPMHRLRSAAGIAVIDNYIYVIGGHDGMSIFNSVERFNVETGDWQLVKPMGSKRCRLGAAALRGKIYVCGGYDGCQFLKSVEVYDPDKDQWSPLSPMHLKRSRVSLVSNAGILYAIAGYDGISNLSSMETYNVEEDSWTLAASMVAHEGGVGIGVIPIAPEML